MQIVIVPAWRRPGFLDACLRRLRIAATGPNINLWVVLDRGFARGCIEVIVRHQHRWPGRLNVIEKDHAYPGNSYAILTAYRDAIRQAPDLIHLVEEDVLVARGYFEYHQQAHDLTSEDAFAVSACRNQMLPDPVPDPTTVYCWGGYQSLGVSFRPSQLAAILPHIREEYFAAQVSYCAQAFPNSFIPPGNAEQDGLLNRIVEDESGVVVYPQTPRAYHAGFTGYHRRGKDLWGTPEQQGTRILSMNTEQLNRAARSHRDHQAIDLDATPIPVTKVTDPP